MRYFRFKAITLSVLIVLSSVFVNSGLMNVAFAENVDIDIDKNKSETFCSRSLADGNPYAPTRYGTLQGDKDHGYYCTDNREEYEAEFTCPDGYARVEVGETSTKTKKYVCTNSKDVARLYQSAENLLKQAPNLSTITNNVNLVAKCMDEANKNTSRNTPIEKDRKKVNQDFFVGCLARETGKDSGKIKEALGDIDPVNAIDITTPEEAAAAEAESSCTLEGGLGWIICPVMYFVANLNDAIWGVIESFLKIKPEYLATAGTNHATYDAWQIFRDLANVIFVILFLFVIFSQITNLGISNYGIKKILPKLIIAAVLINISFFICQIIVDLSDILGHNLNNMFLSFASSVSASQSTSGGWSHVVGGILAGTAGVAVSVYALIAIGLPGLLLFFLSMMLTLMILIGRQAAIILLVALSPLAFAAWILPNTEQYFKKWWKIIFGLLLVYPSISLLYGAGNMAGVIIGSQASDALMQVAALVVTSLPLIATPSLLKNSMNALGSLGGKISGMAGSLNASKYGAGRIKNRVKTGGIGQRFSEFDKARQQRRAMKIANRRAGNGRFGKISQKLDQGKFGRFMGWDKGSYAASAAVDKVAEEEAANILQYKLNGNLEAGLKSDNKHVQRLSAEALSKQGDYGANVLAQHLKNGGQITSVGMAKAFSDVKKSHVGVAKAGTEAIKSLQGKDSPGAVSFNAQQIKDFTATEINGLSAGQLATQTTTAIEDAVIKDANGNEVSAISAEKALSTLNDPTIKGTMSGATEAALRSIAGPLQQQRQQAAQQQAAQQQAAQQRRDQNLEDIAQYVRKSNSKT